MSKNKPIIFVSDIHLSKENSKLTQLFLKFLSGPAKYCHSLYILGDLFEIAIGDDTTCSHCHSIEQALYDLHLSNVKTYFLPGNRDFLIGKGFCKRAKCTLLKEPTCIKLGNQNALLMHGDLLCIDDNRYQTYRKIVRNPITTNLFLSLPLFIRKKIANNLRKSSIKYQQNKVNKKVFDVNENQVIKLLTHNDCTTLIHGHIHKIEKQELLVNEIKAKRFCLGCWHDKGNILVYNNSRFSFQDFS